MSAIKRLKNFIWGDSFFTGNLYLLLLAVATLTAWKLQNFTIALAVYGAAVVVMALFSKSMIGIYPVLAFASLSYGQVLTIDLESSMPLIITGSIFIAAIVAAAIFFFIKNKVSLKPRVQLWGFIAVVIAAALGGVTVKFYATDTTLWLGGIGAAAGLLIAVWLLSCGVKDYNPKFVSKVFMMMATIVVVETFLYFFGMEKADIRTAILEKSLTYGWGVSNAGAVVILMGIPACFYYITLPDERPFIPMILALVFALTIVFIQSRAAQIAGVVILVPCIVLSFALTKRKMEFVEASLIVVIVLAIVYIAMAEQLDELLLRWKAMGLKGNGRDELWSAVIAEIKSGELVTGHGFMHLIPGTSMIMAHNQFLQFMSDFGFIGLGAALLYYAFIYKSLLWRTGVFGLFMCLVILVSDIFGFVDVVLFTPYCMMPLAIALSMSVNARAYRAGLKLAAVNSVANVAPTTKAEAVAAVAVETEKKIIEPINDIIDGEKIPKIEQY